MHSPAENPRYVRAWRGYAGRLVVWIGLVVAFPPAVMLAVNVSREEGRSIPAYVAGAVWVAWFASLAVAWLRVLLWRCPRCAQPFNWDGFARLARRCVQCGLPKRSSSPEDGRYDAVRELPERPPDLAAELTFLQPWDGGRGTPVASGHEAELRWESRRAPVQIGFTDRDLAILGKPVRAKLWIEPAALDATPAPPGTELSLHEGERCIATGLTR